VNIDASGNINASNYSLNGTTIDDWSDAGVLPELSCGNTQVAKWNSTSSSWGCADDSLGSNTTGDIDAVYTNGDYLTGGQSSGTISLLLNESRLNATINSFVNTNITFSPIVGYTTSSYDGNITNGSLIGYVAANAICDANFVGSHFCLKSEILKTIANGNAAFTGEVWFANGPPGYTAAANDCEGWTKVTSEIGPFWDWDENDGAGAGKLTPCSSELQLACCGGNS
jgi:hypothetical protein